MMVSVVMEKSIYIMQTAIFRLNQNTNYILRLD